MALSVLERDGKSLVLIIFDWFNYLISIVFPGNESPA